jgi:hypothetical protein
VSVPREARPDPGALRAAAKASRVRRVAIVLGIAGAFATVVALELPLCPTATFLGLPCPGCGLTRATLRLLHADFAGALALHPLSPALAPLIAWLGSKAALDYIGLGTAQRRAVSAKAARRTSAFGFALLALLLGVWGARFFGAFGGPVSVSSPGRALIERVLERRHGPAASSREAGGGVSSASWPRSTR